MNILALDLGKYSTVFCDYNSTNGEHEFGKVKTIPKDIHDLILSREPERVVLEVCNIAGWVMDIAEALGKGECHPGHFRQRRNSHGKRKGPMVPRGAPVAQRPCETFREDNTC